MIDPLVSVEVYCDGSLSPAKMENLMSSAVSSKFVGRIIVLIPQLDYGVIEQIKGGILTSKGNPDSTQVEALAAKRAKEICYEKGLSNYVVLTDSQGVVNSGIEGVKYLKPGSVHYASLFLDRIMKRARYLRHSSRKIVSRAKPNRLQEELFRMFTSNKSEIQLSKNLLWQKIQMELAVADDSR